MSTITQQLFIEDFVEKIGKIRSGLGKSQEDISKALGITRQTLSNMENQNLSSTENVKGEYRFTNILSMAALYDYYATNDPAVKEVLYSQNFMIFESDYLDYILGEKLPPATTLTEALLRKRSILVNGELEQIIVKTETLRDGNVFLDLLSFRKDADADKTRRRLLALGYRLKKMNGAPVNFYLSEQIRNEDLTRSVEIRRFVQEMVNLKECGRITVTSVQREPNEFIEAACDCVPNGGAPIESKKNYFISNNIDSLLNCTNMIPVLVTTSGMLINVAELNDVQRLFLLSEWNDVVEQDEITFEKLFD